LNYKGLANLPLFSKWFTTLEITHAYSSTYSVGNFVSSLEYQDPNLLRFNQDNSRVHFLGFDTNFNYPFASQLNDGGQSVPVYMMSIISFTEKFGPFIGLNFRTKSKWTGRVEYNQDRNISLNLSNSSISELINKDWVVTLGATKNNVRIPFKVNGKTVRLKNDLTFNMNFTLRDQRAVLRKFGDTTEKIPGVETAGQLMLQFRPQLQYAVDKKLSVSVYFDRMLNDPYVLTSFRRATTQGGIQIRYSLTP
jgi:cell surface protein SprA